MTKPPELNDWVTTHVQYFGKGVAKFADPEGSIEGEVKAVFDEFGRATVEMQVECVNSDAASDLMSFMSVTTENAI